MKDNAVQRAALVDAAWHGPRPPQPVADGGGLVAGTDASCYPPPPADGRREPWGFELLVAFVNEHRRKNGVRFAGFATEVRVREISPSFWALSQSKHRNGVIARLKAHWAELDAAAASQEGASTHAT